VPGCSEAFSIRRLEGACGSGGRCYGADGEMGPRESSEEAADTSREMVPRELITVQGVIFAISQRMEISGRVAIFPERRRSAKTWRNTSLSDSGGAGIRRSRAVCIGRPVVARLGWARSAC
jgi:hypothetical protein